MTKKYADIRLELSVAFEDDGKTELASQAWDALWDMLPLGLSTSDAFAGGEIVGKIRDTEFPA